MPFEGFQDVHRRAVGVGGDILKIAIRRDSKPRDRIAISKFGVYFNKKS